MSRLAAWWAYRRALARLVSARLDLGYGLSPELYRRLRRQARAAVLDEGKSISRERQKRV